MDSGTRETIFAGINVEAEKARQAAGFLIEFVDLNEPLLGDALTAPDQAKPLTSLQIYEKVFGLVQELATDADGGIHKGSFVPGTEVSADEAAVKLGLAHYVPLTTSSPKPGAVEIHSYKRVPTDQGKQLLNRYFGLLGQPTADDREQVQIRHSRQAFADLNRDHGSMTD